MLRTALLSCFVLVSIAHADSVTDVEIDYILNTVAASECVFIRNGKEHNSEAAKSHLELKRSRGKRYFTTADEFIEKLASSSSWSGKPYYIRCGEDKQTANEWFSAVLEEYRNAQ